MEQNYVFCSTQLVLNSAIDDQYSTKAIKIVALAEEPSVVNVLLVCINGSSETTLAHISK